MSASSDLVTSLRDAGAKRVLAPTDAGFRAELAAFNLATTYGPAAVVAATSAADVTATILVAGRLGAKLTVLAFGHGIIDDVDGGIVLTTRGMAGVTIDPDARTARVNAGTTWAEVLAAASPHGLAAMCGSAPSVGVVGFVLGGGLGPISRRHGYAADHVRSIEIVTPAHGLVTASADSHPELFWALRGGKGGFGIVTAMTIELFPIASVYGGGIFFGAADARSVVSTFAAWVKGLPETVTASFALIRLPPLDVLPEPIRGKFVAHVRFVALEPPTTAEALLAPIRKAGTALVDTIGVLPYARIGEVHADPTEPMAVVDAGCALRTFDADAADALLAIAGPDVEAPLAAVEVRHLGGALAREATPPNAVGGREAAFSVFVASAPIPELIATELPRAVARVLEAMAPWRASIDLANFFGRGNTPSELTRCWSAEQNRRLDAVRASADPGRLFPFAGHRVPTRTHS